MSRRGLEISIKPYRMCSETGGNTNLAGVGLNINYHLRSLIGIMAKVSVSSSRALTKGLTDSTRPYLPLTLPKNDDQPFGLI